MQKIQGWLIAALCLLVTTFAGVIWAGMSSDKALMVSRISILEQIALDNRGRMIVLETRFPDLKANLERMKRS